MAKIELTDKEIQKQIKLGPGPKGRRDIADAIASGLCLRLTADRQTWAFVFTPPGEHWSVRTKLSLGTYPSTSLADARTRAREARSQVEAGIDPRNIVAKTPDKTMADLVTERLAMEVDGVPNDRGGWIVKPMRTAAEIRRRYLKYIVPVVGKVAVKDFSIDPDYNLCVDPLKLAGKLRAAGVVHSDLLALMEFAKRRGVIKFSPVDATVSADPKNTRKRFLSLEEIRHFWNHCPKALIRSPKVQMILKVCLATSKRSNEVCGARRSEIDWAERLWIIPKERVKAEEADAEDEVVPLSDLAFALLSEAARRSNSEWLFPDDDADGPYQPGVVSKAVLLALEPAQGLPLGRLGMAKWTPHDLRRTVGTQMLAKVNGLRITKEQKYLALNHASENRKNASDEHYDMNDYLDDKREALEKWGAFLADLVGVQTGLRVAA